MTLLLGLLAVLAICGLIAWFSLTPGDRAVVLGREDLPPLYPLG
jgi:hypothetical protein